jgi:hypothetical protein
VIRLLFKGTTDPSSSAIPEGYRRSVHSIYVTEGSGRRVWLFFHDRPVNQLVRTKQVDANA